MTWWGKRFLFNIPRKKYIGYIRTGSLISTSVSSLTLEWLFLYPFQCKLYRRSNHLCKRLFILENYPRSIFMAMCGPLFLLNKTFYLCTFILKSSRNFHVYSKCNKQHNNILYIFWTSSWEVVCLRETTLKK